MEDNEKEIFYELATKWEDEGSLLKQNHCHEEYYALTQAANELRKVLNGDIDFINKFYGSLKE